MPEKLGNLEPVELKDIWPDEAQDFTPWLAKEENLTLLGETLDMELELEAQEIYVGDFRADILCRNTEWRNQRDGLCCTELYMTGKNASAHFYLLKEEREEIESEFGESLVWQEKIKNVVVSQGFDNLKDESDWPNQHKWLADNLEKLDKVFRPRVKALNADDWEPPEDEDDE